MIDPATAVTLASAAVGAFGGGGGQEKIQAMEHIPRFLRGTYENLAGQVEGMPAPEYFQGSTVAPMNPMLSGSIDDMYGWGSGTGGDVMNQMLAAGGSGLNAFNQGLDYLDSVAGGPGFQYDQGTYDQAFGNLSGGLQNAFDLGAQQINQNLDWNTLPGIDMSAAMSGQQGSTRQGQQSALAESLANQNIRQLGSDLWMNAANQANQNAITGGMQNMQNQNQLMRAYGNYGAIAPGMMNQGFNMGLSNMGLGLDASQLQQGYDQSLVDADVARWNFEQNMPMNHLQWQLSMLPGPGGASPGMPGMTAAEGAIMGAQAGAGIYGAGQDMGWWGTGSTPPYVPPSGGRTPMGPGGPLL